MPSLDQDQLVPPRLKRKVRRFEIVAGAGALLLLVVTGLVHTIGAARATRGQDELLRTRRFRPLVADFKGQVEYRAFGTLEWRPLRWSDAFEQGDQLRTGPDSTCDVLLTWATGVHLAEGSEITWSKLASRGAVKEVELKLASGRVLASLDNLPDGSLFEVVTRHSRTRVKGTTLSVSADDEKTHVTVLEGVVEVVDTTDPSRRVEVSTGKAVDTRSGGRMGDVMPLSATERAQLLGEIGGVDKRIERVAPQAPKAETAEKPKQEATEPTPTGASTTTSTSDATLISGPTEADYETVKDLMRAVVELINGGRTASALEYCTPTFRALIWGPSARRLGVPEEFRLSDGGEGRAEQVRQRVDQTVSLKLKIVRMEVVIEEKVAYGSAVIEVDAVAREGSRSATRRYACTSRVLKGDDGQWRLDLATATEGAEGTE